MAMFTMKPIDEYDVVEIINNGRFEGDLTVTFSATAVTFLVTHFSKSKTTQQ